MQAFALVKALGGPAAEGATSGTEHAIARPLLLRALGEVFWGPVYGACPDVDMVLYRSKEHPPAGCLTLHYIQGVAFAHSNASHPFHVSCSVLCS